jgi:hypothetical protein
MKLLMRSARKRRKQEMKSTSSTNLIDLLVFGDNVEGMKNQSKDEQSELT